MYSKFYTTRFQKSLKKILRSGKIKREDIEVVVNILASGQMLSVKYQDHSLQGIYKGFRECHIKGGLFSLTHPYKLEFVRV
ncbi:hypothetical protein A2914_02600 [Candidatus Nomurabacteria bacterium RIFCSPLOWO2_01_FULL_41_21]|uniref:Addiction module toxin RelE n=2 Tax=Candidatus Nomuraibacteriota TaxID=1752729 RepID=A0A1F6V1P8_9BACT|nr:MAG: hypothetical protein A2733_01755 [Candidatus Nomurabacteria bacterium RIFCSPHIGHO2_01_FULL_40_20]OGI88553.1 MAG: hypothetical protein A2914_02600 [Candidatus Nomurabacteria bacterium RIFCSPLOWO2_01_FULL_41_21]